MIVMLLTGHHLEFLSLKGVYTCQNATLLEIICRGTYAPSQDILVLVQHASSED